MKKFLSLILILTLLLSSSMNLFSVSATDTKTTSVSENTAANEIISPYHLLSYNAITNYNNNISDMDGISISKKGVNQSFVLEI